MKSVRILLGQALAALLLLQWIGAPAHCLAMVSAALDGTVICHAEGSGTHPGDGPGGIPVSIDQCCPACHALGHAVLAAEPPSPPAMIVWPAALPLPPRTVGLAAAPRAPPQQPRAPPARSV